MTIDEERRGERPEGSAPEDGTPGKPAESSGEEVAPGDPARDQPPTGSDAGGDEPPESAGDPGERQPSEDAPEPAGKSAAESGPGGEEAGRARRGGRAADGGREEAEVVPGADLEPDLVLDQPARPEGDEYGDDSYAARYAEPEAEEEPAAGEPAEPPATEAPAPRSPMRLAADARYRATGKRKTAVARVVLKPGSGAYTVNGRSLEHFFPRFGLQATARQPLAAAGYETRMDVVARLHGGGVSAQAGALRHGVARALVEADPNLREDLKRRGYLTRDPRAKERKKAGLKKARKRPQFSKR